MSALSDAYSFHGERLIKNLENRTKLYSMMDDKKFAEHERNLCGIDYDPAIKETTGILRFFENHLWTHEPRGYIRKQYHPSLTKIPSLPFVLFDFQKEVVLKLCDCIRTGQDILIEKSRDMGVTWLVVLTLFWYWWKGVGGDFLLGSRKLEYVDRKGATDTLFQKIRYNLYKLHSFMFPHGFVVNKHDNVNLLIHPVTGNFFRGESNNENFGTSGRYESILMDEFSKWLDTDSAAWVSVGDSSPCKIVVSTPFGIGREFAKLRFSGAIEVLTLHWSEHPIKSAGKHRGQHPYFSEMKDVWLSEWYLKECERRKDNPEGRIGQELDINYLKSGTPYFRFQMLKLQNLYKELSEIEIGKSHDFIRDGNNIEIYEAGNGRIIIRKDCIDNWSYRYLITADVAEGLETGDNSSFVIFDRVLSEDVAWFTGKVDTVVFGLLLIYFGYLYNEAYIGVENNNNGIAVVKTIIERYDNMMHEMDYSREVDLETVKIGWNTNLKTRGIMFSDVREAIDKGFHGIYDPQTVQECMTIVTNRKNGRPEADKGYNDDRVIAQGIKWQLHKWLPSPMQGKEDVEKVYNIPRFGGIDVGEGQDIRKIW